jgi:hypothetical protein
VHEPNLRFAEINGTKFKKINAIATFPEEINALKIIPINAHHHHWEHDGFYIKFCSGIPPWYIWQLFAQGPSLPLPLLPPSLPPPPPSPHPTKFLIQYMEATYSTGTLFEHLIHVKPDVLVEFLNTAGDKIKRPASIVFVMIESSHFGKPILYYTP